MARAPSTFRQQDVTRAVKAVAAAGVDIARVEIDAAGKIVIVASKNTGVPENSVISPLDTWMAKHAGETEGH
jgi:hypothetical protein